MELLKKHPDKIAAAAVIAVTFAISLLGILDRFDLRLYDSILSLRKEPEERPEILFVEIDNQSLDALGAWPWSRDILANALFRMKELGAEAAVFDIEYLSPSKLGVNPDAKSKISYAVEEQKNDINDVISQFAGAAVSGSYSAAELDSLSEEIISGWINPGLDRLRDGIYESAYQDNDKLFAKSIAFFGNTWLTINTAELEIKYDDDYLDYVRKKCLYSNVKDKDGLIKKGNDYYLVDQGSESKPGFSPAMEMFIRSAKGAGFTNVVLDKDGTRRRIELLSKQNDSYAAQLVFAPILKKIKPREIVRNSHSLKLKDVTDPDTGELTDINIPLDEHGRILINWLNKDFVNSFRHENVIMLYQLDETERNIISCLENLGGFNLWDKDGKSLPFKQETLEILNDYSGIRNFREYLLEKCQGFDENGESVNGGISDDEYESYFAARKSFFERVTTFINGSYLEEMLNRLDEMKNEIANISEIKNSLESLFDTLKNESEIYNSTFEEKQKSYNGSFCIIGNTASSTTDLGTTPFNRAYPNIGTHANLYNTIISRNFIREIHWIAGMLAAAVLAFLTVVISGKKSGAVQSFYGILSVILASGVPVLLLAVFQIYVPMTGPVILTVLSYLATVIIRFVTTEKEKNTIRNSFSVYLNPTVVEQLAKDPSKLKLGGEEKNMTALFSDIKGFSSFSEQVTPEKLVSILNGYLGSMSEKILEEGGTIDKFIGDSIVSFFGAPLDLEDSAFRACVSAIKMKQAEDIFNRENLKSGNIPEELKTRIGINTGDMLVGNMGTTTKMNYTIMGDSVNLASRLEGVNKAYKSWILCSDSTWNEANEGGKNGLLAARKLDAVRVVGRNEPVQLWNILGFESELSDAEKEALAIYNCAMEKYTEKNFREAGKLFVKANALTPLDETPLVFASRCREFIKNGVPKNWDGIINMTSK